MKEVALVVAVVPPLVWIGYCLFAIWQDSAPRERAWFFGVLVWVAAMFYSVLG